MRSTTVILPTAEIIFFLLLEKLGAILLIMHAVVFGIVVALISISSARPAQHDILDTTGRAQGFPAQYLPSPLRNA